MALTAGDLVTLDVERPVAGGRMLARHEGRVVLVSNAIPGERVTARIERVEKNLAHAEAVDVLQASPDRRAAADWKCGGRAYAHITYSRQLALKADVIADAFRRIGRLPLAELPPVLPSPEQGYRMRARLHAGGGRLGFYREGSHAVCDAALTGQLSDTMGAWVARAEATLPPTALDAVTAVEVAENARGDQLAVHVEARTPVDLAALRELANGLTGLTLQHPSVRGVVEVAGRAVVEDEVFVGMAPDAPRLTLARNVRSFFQGNRFLIEPFVALVAGAVNDGPVLDLYAGVGLFGLALAAAGRDAVTLVEGDRTSGEDLEGNARPYGPRVRVVRDSVEAALAARPRCATCIVDPPRTGLSPAARTGLLRMRPARLVYVSCDPATLARDSRVLVDAGYELVALTSLDLFPTTAHIETVAVFDRPR